MAPPAGRVFVLLSPAGCFFPAARARSPTRPVLLPQFPRIGLAEVGGVWDMAGGWDQGGLSAENGDWFRSRPGRGNHAIAYGISACPCPSVRPAHATPAARGLAAASHRRSAPEGWSPIVRGCSMPSNRVNLTSRSRCAFVVPSGHPGPDKSGGPLQTGRVGTSEGWMQGEPRSPEVPVPVLRNWGLASSIATCPGPPESLCASDCRQGRTAVFAVATAGPRPPARSRQRSAALPD